MLVKAVNKAGYIPSINRLIANKKGEVPVLRPFFGLNLREVLKENIETMLLHCGDPARLSSLLWHMLMDEVATEQRLSWAPASNQVRTGFVCALPCLLFL
jgi:hypothetical protein